MQALVLSAPGKFTYQTDRPVPMESPGADSVLVQVAACGICGSDLPRAFEPGGAYRYPLVLGHEFSAVVAEDGPGVKKGDRVAVFPLVPKPGEKAYDTGDFAQTTNYDYFGSRRDGGMQQALRVPVQNLFPLPPHVRLLHAACAEPAAVALHAVRKMRPSPTGVAVVIGAGPVGNFAAQWLRLSGCLKVLVVDVEASKLELAAAMGFEPVDARAGDPVAQIRERTGGDGASRVVEACGLPATFVQALECAGAFGEVVLMGNLHGELRLPQKAVSSILRRELIIHGTWNSKIVPRGQDDWSTVLQHMDRDLAVAPLISDTPSLSSGPEIFESLRMRRRPHNKVIFRVSPELL